MVILERLITLTAFQAPIMPIKKVIASIIVLCTSGCASLATDPTADWSAAEFYNEAHTAVDDGNYQTALDYFSKLEARYPYGNYAQQAQLETIYAHYKLGESEAAVAAAERFIKLHPRHENAEYAYYIRGLAAYDSNSNFLTDIFSQDPTERDPHAIRTAFDYFKELVTRFPDSRYNEDAIQRMTALRNALARYELNVAGFYLRRDAQLAALNRAKYIVEHYPRSTSVPDALALMVRIYRELGMDELATDSLRVLSESYANSPALQSLRETGRGNRSTTEASEYPGGFQNYPPSSLAP